MPPKAQQSSKEAEPRKVNLHDGNSLKAVLDECAHEASPCPVCNFALQGQLSLQVNIRPGAQHTSAQFQSLCACHHADGTGRWLQGGCVHRQHKDPAGFNSVSSKFYEHP